MFMKIANARKNRNKGFSLIELIIVIAIMVALVAVMAPQFIKYVQKSRNAALKTAAEDYMSAVKVLYVDNEDPTASYSHTGSIVLSSSTGTLSVTKTGEITDAELTAFNSAAGLSTMPSMGKANVTYTITIDGSATNGFTFKITET